MGKKVYKAKYSGKVYNTAHEAAVDNANYLRARKLTEQTNRIPATYIGGTPQEARAEYWRQEPVMQHAVDSIAGRYGIDPAVLKHRLDKEGFTDSQIDLRNLMIETGRSEAIPPRGYEILNRSHQRGVTFGLDDAKDYIESGKVKLINENWGDTDDFENEKGRTTHPVQGDTVGDNIGIVAAHLKYFRDKAREDFPNASEEDLNRYAQAYFNRGEAGGKKWVESGAKGYNYKAYGGSKDSPWNNLSMVDKAAMMEVAIRNGITTLPEIRKAYNEFAEGGDKDVTPLEYTHQRFPITEGFNVHTYMDPNFTPRDIGNYGDIEYMQAQYDSLPYYNNYQKPDSLRGKSVVVYNDRLGEGTNESIALDILSHGLREQDNTWKTKYLPTLMQAYNEDAEYFADKEGVTNKEEFKNSFVDGKVRAMLVDDKMRGPLNYQSKEDFLDEYRHSTPEQQNALTEAYSYIFPTQLPEVVVKGKRKKKSLGGNLFEVGGPRKPITTGGAGYIPSEYSRGATNAAKQIKSKAANKVRQTIYDRVDPTSYRIPYAAYQLLFTGRSTGKDDVYNALWARYLNRSNTQAGQNVDELLQPASYAPTKGTPIGKLYKLTPKAWKEEDDMNPLGDRQLYNILKSGKKSYVVRGAGETMTGLGDYTVSLGEDENGKYMSYYDEWDLAPVGNKSGKNAKDQSLGIGTPFSVYDRRYYTDDEAQAILKYWDNYFQEYNKKYGFGKKSFGGNLFGRGGNKKQAFLTSLDQSLNEDNRFDNAQWRQFFTDLADMESGYSSNITNSIGAKGYFQLMPFNRAKTWNNPTQQFHEMYKLTGNNLNYLNKNLTKEDWKRADALGIDMYGMLAGAHLGGAGNVLKALRGKGNAKDMNGTSVMGYMTKFSQRGKTPTLAASSYVEEPMPLFTPSNPEVFFGGYKAPEIEAPLPSVELDETPQYSEEEVARQERRERLNNLSMLMSLTSPQGSSNSMLDAIGLLMR